MTPTILALMLAGLGSAEAVEPSFGLASELSPVAPITAPILFAAADDEGGSPFSYTYLEIGGSTLDIDNLSEDADIYFINASLALGMFYVLAGYENQDVDFMSTKADQLSLGFGLHLNMSPKLDIAADLSWLYSDVSSGIPSIDDSGTGYQLRVMPRWMLLDWDRGGLELNATALWLDLENRLASDDSAFGWGVGARAHFLALLSVGVNWLDLEDDDRISFDLRASL